MLRRFQERIYPVRSSYRVALVLILLFPVEVAIIQWTDMLSTATGTEGLDGFIHYYFLSLQYDYGVILGVCGILVVGMTLLAVVRPNGCRKCIDLICLVMIVFHSIVFLWILGPLRGGR